MIAAPSSGSGKTTFTCGLLRILKDMGLDPVSYKCGPDYIDPMFHRQVLEIGSRNLDSYLMNETQIKHALGAAGNHPAVVEGVMGIYDGTDVRGISGSSYEIALMCRIPIILCLDARGTGRTLISIIKGILADDTGHLIKGIVLNRISPGFYEKTAPVLTGELADAGYHDVRLLGFMPKADEIAIGSRHLGLMLPGEIPDIRERIAGIARLITGHIDIDSILRIMDKPGENAESVADDETGRGTPGTDTSEAFTSGADIPKPVLAVARDEAFCFYYQDNIELLEQMGVEVKYFSPIHDERIPEDADGLLLGGGYPELFLKELAGNRSMLDSVRNAIRGGMPSLAECGGFMYLHESVYDRDGTGYSLTGVIDGECRYTGHLVRFGYMYIRSCDEPEGPASALPGIRGHEFHYYESSLNGDACTCAKPDGTEWKGMIADSVSLWGFPHLYYGSKPEFAEAFTNSMRRYERTGLNE